ncbi:MAG: HPr family phosphocarrier protein [Anaerovibrio sp.]|uniref:HPr family phosphocarrier protein n=1 Tax=Anaerovibrio sp. TaxID=1872532 RepID=UPI0025EEB214|nr:HPr family phosphocarrier protein [Anaerovibrio sp.]MCR5175997.1 HPr family phosphocarrier protein [Anaerovibrio sp.]
MQELTLKVLNKAGLHARPAKELVKFSRGIKSEVFVKFNGKSANIKSMMGVMGLGAKKDADVTLTVDGPDEAEVVKALTDMFAQGFGFTDELE